VGGVTIGLDRARTRLATLGARAPWAVDVLIVVAILALSRHGTDSPATHEAFLWSVGLTLPLFARRRWPVGVFALIATIAFAQWAVGPPAFGDASLLVALYAVASARPLRVTLVAAVVLEIGTLLAATRWSGDEHTINAFLALSAMTTAAAVIGINVRSRRALLSSLRERAVQLEHERDQQGRLSAAAERARIAREMHDVVAHNLSVMIALADGASFTADDDPRRATEAMALTAQTGRQALAEMRGLLGVLRDDGEVERAPQPGIPQLDELVDQVRAAGLPVQLELSGRPETLPPGVQLTLFRLVQEALTNTLKHAGAAARASVALRYDAPDSSVVLDVADTGGPGAAPTPAPDGRGLAGMRERAALHAGTVAAGPRDGGAGWLVHVRLNLPA
jgi:signal transduction histidine kinase